MDINLTAKELYKSILYRAADIYEVEYDDVETDIGQQFDPVVRFMAGAVAHELEQVYNQINATERRLQNRLANVLLPEYFHLPQPAHALARARSNSDSFLINETTGFNVESDMEEKNNISLTPIFPSRILPAEIKIIATEDQIIDLSKRTRVKRNSSGEKEEVKRILLGFESAEPITNWQGATLFFDLKGTGTDEGEKALFYAALNNSICAFQGAQLSTQNGLPHNEIILEDYLNGNERYQSIVRARYERHFLTFTDDMVPEGKPMNPKEFLSKWFEINLSEKITQQIDKLNPESDKPMYWLEIQLSKPVEISQVRSKLSIRFNVFPVVNRRLNGKDKGSHYYLRNNAIKWVSLEPEEDFLAIRRVYEESPPAYPVFTYKPFADFKEERTPSYTLRQGGVGRWDDFNTWQRLAYVVGILQENYKHQELIDKAASSLSLEEIHHLLGKKISKESQDEKPTQNIYVLLHSGVASSMRVRVEYWTSQGTKANNLQTKSKLKCITKHKANFDKESIRLQTTTVDGRDPLNSSEQLNAMKQALLSRGRIVTREDVKVFCQTFLSDKLESVVVQDGVGTDPRFDFGMTRILEVILKPTKKAIRDDWEGICQQIQSLLEKKSTSSIPIIVKTA